MAKKSECPEPSGILLIIGGKENKGEDKPANMDMPDDFEPLEVLKKFIELTQKQNPNIVVITSASGEGEASFEEYQKVFKKLNAGSINQIHHNSRKEIKDEELIEMAKQADGFFFAGGDQLKYTSLYGGSRFLTYLKERYINDKIVVAGTSAGAMALSTPMIYAGSQEAQELGGEIKVTTGLEFLKDVCIDTHFVHRGRFIRMAQVVVTNPTCIGMGIEEDTAIIIRNGLDAEVVGTGSIIIIEGFDITEFNVDDFPDKKPITIRDLKVHILSSGDHYLVPQFNPPHK